MSAIRYPRAKLSMSRRIFTETQSFTMTLSNTNVIIHNDHSFHAVLVQIKAVDNADTFTFEISTDETNFIPLRAWDITNEIYTTASLINGGSTAIFSIYIEGMKDFKISKASGVTSAVIQIVMHKSPGSHVAWTSH